MGGCVHVASAEVFVPEVHGVAFLGGLGDLAEAVHVELADEGGDVLVAEVVGEDSFLQLPHILYVDLAVGVPAKDIGVFRVLRGAASTSRMW
jgi:hypothetical protein